MAGEIEYSFRHALMRDVAYEQIPRAQRADKHRRTADWIESLGRPEDHAEMLAHHWGAALEYARATGGRTDEFEERARSVFREAGERSYSLHAFRRAAHFYERSLELSDDADPKLLLHYGRALGVAGDERATETLEAAAGALMAAGDREAAAEAHAFLTEALHLQGRGEAAYGHMEQALELVRDAPPSAAKVRVLAESSRVLALGEGRDAQALAQEAYEMATALGLVDLAARALANRGIVKTNAFDLDGAIVDSELSIELARSVSSPEEARARHNLGSATWFRGELAPATAHFAEAVRVGEHFGVLQTALASRSVLCGTLYPTGAWPEALALANELIGELQDLGVNYFEYHPLTARARIALAQGDNERALADVRRAAEVGRAAGDRQVLVPVLSQLAFVTAELDLLDEATAAAREFASLVGDLSPMNIHRAIDIAWVASRLDCVEPLRRLTFTAPESHIWRVAVVAILDEDYDRAASVLAQLGHVDEGYARLRSGERAIAESRRAEANGDLREAIAFFRRLGATSYVRRAENVLASAGLEIPA